MFFLTQTLSTVFVLPTSVQYLHDRAAFSYISECGHPLNGLQEFSAHSSPACSCLRWRTKLIRPLTQNSSAYLQKINKKKALLKDLKGHYDQILDIHFLQFRTQ